MLMMECECEMECVWYRGREGPVVIVDKRGKDSDEEDDQFVAEEEEDAAMSLPTARSDELDDDGQHGQLVKKILEAKRGAEPGSVHTLMKKAPVSSS